MPWVVHQDYAHHINAEAVRVLAPWHLFDRDASIDPRIAKVWLPDAKIPALEAQVEREYMGDPPPVALLPLPEPEPEYDPFDEESV